MDVYIRPGIYFQLFHDLKNVLILINKCEIARENLTKGSQRYRKYYNRSARDKDLAVGSKVLVLLPTKNNKLLLQWRGPYEIMKKVGT